MKPHIPRCAWVLLAALFGPSVHADFPAAIRDYRDGHFEAAHAEFLRLATLGDNASQFNLGAMALQGQAGPKDLATAVGWLTAAAENGSRRFAPEKLADLRARLTDEQRSAADDIVARYGRDALQRTALPVPPQRARCRDLTPARIRKSVAPDSEFYPRGGRFSNQNGFVILELTVGVDGVPRDPEIMMSVPTAEFSAAAIDYWLQVRYYPAVLAGVPVESRVQVKSEFKLTDGGSLWDIGDLKKIRETALTGDPAAQWQIGLAATLDPSLGIPPDQAQQLLVSAAQGGEPRAEYWAANRFMSLGSCDRQSKKMPWLRASAAAGEGAAQLALAVDLLNSQPSAAQMSDARALLEQATRSEDFYVRKHVAALLASSPIEAIRDPASALEVAKKLWSERIEADPQMFEAVAAAYAANHHTWDAVATQKAAIKRATVLGWNTRSMEERLGAYQQSRAWTGDLFVTPVEGTP